MVMGVDNPRELYNDASFWYVVVGVFCGVAFLTKLFLLAGVLALIVMAIPLVLSLIPSLLNGLRTQQIKNEDVGDGILLGRLENKIPIYLTPASMNHMFIIGMTRYGKTRLALSIITEFIQNYRPEELRLAFSDAKAVSFNVFGRSQHLWAPIAKSPEQTERLIELILTEMHIRLATFSEYHEEICTNVDEYFELSGIRLPRIVVIFDEVADSVEQGSIAEKNLTTLAKMGLAAGIHLVLVTQRPTNMGISHEVTSQCQTIMCTFMKNAVEYGSVAKIPKDVYVRMKPKKGLFMLFSPDLAPMLTALEPDNQGWGFLTSNYVRDPEIVHIAQGDSTSNLDLPDLEDSLPAWRGSEEDKLAAMAALEAKLGKVTGKDMKKYFAVGGRTARTWIEKFYGSQ